MSRFSGLFNILAVLALLLSSPQMMVTSNHFTGNAEAGSSGEMVAGDPYEVYLPVVSSIYPSLSPSNRITAGFYHTCALTPVGTSQGGAIGPALLPALLLGGSGGVKCWGSNYYGQIGDGTTTWRFTAVAVQGLASGVAGISAGMGHTCALTAGGGAKCWGLNTYGALGDGTTTDRHAPVDVQGLTKEVGFIAAGGWHTCALVLEGAVMCWGANNYGQLGDGTTTDRYAPVLVQGLTSGAIAVGGGENHTCALTREGGVKCWGRNYYGQLGDGTTTDRSAPVEVLGLTSGVRAISVGWEHTCALTAGWGVKCWGNNLTGQLGDGSTTDRHAPVDVKELTGEMSAVAAGAYHTCAMTIMIPYGKVKCWGYNVFGELGDGTFDNHLTPIDVPALANGVTVIAAGAYHTCAMTPLGVVKCWGDNVYGQLGDGTGTSSPTPVDVVGFP